jgi:hypothetical protein
MLDTQPQTVREDGRRETPLERLDRNLVELTGELRVVLTGVQVLFAFLLIVPFDSGFAGIGDFERTVYFVTLLLAALAAACTIAPSAQHRFLFRHDDKQQIVSFSNRAVIAGLAFLALAMCGCLLLVAVTLFGELAGVLTVLFGAIPFALLWFALPLRPQPRARGCGLSVSRGPCAVPRRAPAGIACAPRGSSCGSSASLPSPVARHPQV